MAFVLLIFGFVAGWWLGWWLKAIYYKRSYLLRTTYEWYADDRVRRKYGDTGELDAIMDGRLPIDDANVPWWMP